LIEKKRGPLVTQTKKLMLMKRLKQHSLLWEINLHLHLHPVLTKDRLAAPVWVK
jgi:hypothetical protein